MDWGGCDGKRSKALQGIYNKAIRVRWHSFGRALPQQRRYWVWWCRLAISALGMWKQKDQAFNISHSFIVASDLARVI